jgi:DNA-binding transcriptional MerR regulator
MYGEDAVERLAFISSAKLLGLVLEEIRDLLAVREEGVCASVRARMLPLVADRITETDSRIAELRAFVAHLAGVHAGLRHAGLRPAPGSDGQQRRLLSESRGPGQSKGSVFSATLRRQPALSLHRLKRLPSLLPPGNRPADESRPWRRPAPGAQ